MEAAACVCLVQTKNSPHYLEGSCRTTTSLNRPPVPALAGARVCVSLSCRRRLMSTSDPAFKAAVDADALSLVTNLTEDASDVLLQLNALELLEQVTRQFWRLGRRSSTLRESKLGVEESLPSDVVDSYNII